jgi:hypothetical protein
MFKPFRELLIFHIKSGNITDGRKLLLEVRDENPGEEKAWLWMYQCVSSTNQKAECLRRALAINPSKYNEPNTQSKKASNLSGSTAPMPSKSTKSPAQKKKSSGINIWVPVFVAILIFEKSKSINLASQL